MDVPLDFDDLETVKSWSFQVDGVFLIQGTPVPGVLRSNAASIRQVNAAYKVAASAFSKKWMALHDRAIKAKLREMAQQVQGNFSGLVQQATESPKSLEEEDSKINGMLMLRPVLLKRQTGAQEDAEYFFYPSVKDEERERLVLDERNFFEVALDLPANGGERPIVRAHDAFGDNIDVSGLERFDVPGARPPNPQLNLAGRYSGREFVNQAYIHTEAGNDGNTSDSGSSIGDAVATLDAVVRQRSSPDEGSPLSGQPPATSSPQQNPSGNTSSSSSTPVRVTRNQRRAAHSRVPSVSPSPSREAESLFQGSPADPRLAGGGVRAASPDSSDNLPLTQLRQQSRQAVNPRAANQGPPIPRPRRGQANAAGQNAGQARQGNVGQNAGQAWQGNVGPLVIRHEFVTQRAAPARRPPRPPAQQQDPSSGSEEEGGSAPEGEPSRPRPRRRREDETGQRGAPEPEGEGDEVPAVRFSSIYTLLKGYAGETGGMNRYLPTELSAGVWEEMMQNEWSIDLPARETMQIKGYLAHARDSTTFSALRLDLIGDEIQTHLADFYAEGDGGSIDFDQFPFPFEERMHREDLKATTKKLNTLARWLTLCLYDTEEVPLGPTDDPAVPREERVSIASHRFWERILDNDSRGLSMDRTPNILELFDAPFKSLITLRSTIPQADEFYLRCQDRLRDNFSEQLILNSSLQQEDTTIVPYVMPFIDFTSKDGFVWGSTITPFLLAVSAAPTLLSMFLTSVPLEERVGQQGMALNQDDVGRLTEEYARYERRRDRSTVDERRRFYGSTYPTRAELWRIEASDLCNIFWDRFKGLHFSNRKALNNGVYAVMFPQSPWFQQNYVMNAQSTPTQPSAGTAQAAPDARTNLIVPVHGRFPIQKTDVTLLGCLLSLLVELGNTQFETARRMGDLVTPYNVMVRGPGEGALSTAMQLGDYWFFTSVMLALENEACQLLGHIARDNRKRKREAHWVVSDIFLQSGVTDFYILQTRLEAHRHPEGQHFLYAEFSAALVRLVRAIKSFNDCMNDAGRTMRDRVVMGRIDGERMVAGHEVLYGNWIGRQ